MPYKAHLFICTNSADKPGKCGAKNAETLRSQIKDRCKQESWSQDVRINSSGCLGHCERGIAVVLYPKGKWFFKKTDKDSDELFQEIKNALKISED